MAGSCHNSRHSGRRVSRRDSSPPTERIRSNFFPRPRQASISVSRAPHPMTGLRYVDGGGWETGLQDCDHSRRLLGRSPHLFSLSSPSHSTRTSSLLCATQVAAPSISARMKSKRPTRASFSLRPVPAIASLPGRLRWTVGLAKPSSSALGAPTGTILQIFKTYSYASAQPSRKHSQTVTRSNF